jgi:glucosamine--fructose-6-phosphate aminotransferase (isomerizing)
MCGIVGYVGEQDALPILMRGLKRLEYRGYDSAGVALVAPDGVALAKSEGKVAVLETRLDWLPRATPCGIAHTRWATHGSPTDDNAHPHCDCSGDIAVVHNGIVENYRELRAELVEKGHHFRSETDSEVIPHLIEEYGGARDLVAAARAAETRLQGAYAFLAVSSKHPDLVVAVRRASPLIIGMGRDGNYIGSDFSAFLDATNQAVVLENGEMAAVGAHEVTIWDAQGQRVTRSAMSINWDVRQAERGGYPHFMLKEIMEQPEVWADCLLGRVERDSVNAEAMGLNSHQLGRWQRIQIVAAGTAYHAGLVGKALIENLAGVPVDVDVASEFRYRHPLLAEETLILAVSQSGETADTLASVQLAKDHGFYTYAITNTVGSTLAREADAAGYTYAGPEIAVASTKAYTSQILMLTVMALALAQARQRPRPDLVRQLSLLPALGEQWLAQSDSIRDYAELLAASEQMFYIGRGLDYALAMEGQLKMKEISYIHAEAYPAGELKHGTLALITADVPVVALSTQPELAVKLRSNVEEVKARGARILGIIDASQRSAWGQDAITDIHAPSPWLAPVLTAMPLQLLAYWTAVTRGEDVDKPRNLAKSVTVE